MFCSNCGKQIADGHNFCAACGAPISSGNGLVVATLGKRFGAYVLDYIFIILFFIVVGVVASSGFSENGANILVTIAYVGIIFYYIIFEWVWGQTFGKMIVGIKVVRENGEKFGFWRSVGRYFLRAIPFDALSVFRKSRRAWHDTLSKTVVVPVQYTAEDVRGMNLNRDNGGSGLIWVIVLVLIFLPIFVSIVLLSLNSARAKVRDAARIEHVTQIRDALEMYRIDHDGQYPARLQDLHGQYLSTVPTPPQVADGQCLPTPDYPYTLSEESGSYFLGFCLGAESLGYAAGNHIIMDGEIDPSNLDDPDELDSEFETF